MIINRDKQIIAAMQQQELSFDISRNNRLYEIKIPTYHHLKESVFYQVHLIELVNNQTFIHCFRFNELKTYYQSFQAFKQQLPEFPKTHFWKKTNKNPKMIQERKAQLEKCFNILINEPNLRGSHQMKQFIKACKYGDRVKRAFSAKNYSEATRETKSESMKEYQLKFELKS